MGQASALCWPSWACWRREARWLCKYWGWGLKVGAGLLGHKFRRACSQVPSQLLREAASVPCRLPDSWLQLAPTTPPPPPARSPDRHVSIPGFQAALFQTHVSMGVHTAHVRAFQSAPHPCPGTTQPDPNYRQPPSFIINRLRLPSKGTDRQWPEWRRAEAPGPQSPCAAGHRARLRQAWQRGWTGRQVCWPKPTSRLLISRHSSLWGWGSSVWSVEGGSPPEGAHPAPPHPGGGHTWAATLPGPCGCPLGTWLPSWST